MRTPASIFRHPIHPMVVALPIGLWIFSLVCDIIYRTPAGGPTWLGVALYTMVGGIVGALGAAVPGIVDYIAVKKGSDRVKRIGAAHMTLNIVILLMYTANAWIRFNHDPSSNLGFGLSIAANLLLIVSGWLGGEMIYVEHVSVSDREPAKRY